MSSLIFSEKKKNINNSEVLFSLKKKKTQIKISDCGLLELAGHFKGKRALLPFPSQKDVPY